MSVNDSLKTDRLLAALLEAPTIKRAAEVAGVSYSTALRILAHPEVQERLREMRAEATREALDEATQLARLARATLAEVMLDEGAALSVKVRAAEIVLTYAQKMTELVDLAERLIALEQRVSESVAG